MMERQMPVVRYVGTYRFVDRGVLEQALVKARGRITEKDELAALAGGWLRCFVMYETSLTVNLALPASAEHRVVADEVFATLAREAIEGSVRATIDE